jgi:hypothetical protein
LIWFCCDFQVVLEIFMYFNMHKLLFKFGGEWQVLHTCRQVGVVCALSVMCAAPKLHRTPTFRKVFDVPHRRSRRWGTCSWSWRRGASTSSFSLPPSLLPLLLGNRASYCKNTKKYGYLFWLQCIWSWIIYWANLFFSISSLNTWFLYKIWSSFFKLQCIWSWIIYWVIFFYFIPLHLIFKLNLVFILLIMMCLV